MRYSMDFHWRDGKVTRERNIDKCYNVRQLLDEDRWVLLRNDDFQCPAPHLFSVMRDNPQPKAEG